MKIFICWSGRRGRRAAGVLARWLRNALGPSVEPRVSMGMEKGLPWQEELTKFLGEANVGLICMTPEALRSPWVSYEAGFLSRAMTGKGDAAPTGSKPSRLFT